MLRTRRVLPIPASPSMASTDACPSLSWRTAAAATVSSASRPTSPSPEDTLKAPPRPKLLQRQRPAEGRLSQSVSHSPRPPPFTGGPPDRVCAVRGRWRTLASIAGKRAGGNPSGVQISYLRQACRRLLRVGRRGLVTRRQGDAHPSTLRDTAKVSYHVWQ